LAISAFVLLHGARSISTKAAAFLESKWLPRKELGIFANASATT